jgi:hypothetical protein
MLKCQKGTSMLEVDVEMQKGASMLGKKEVACNKKLKLITMHTMRFF